ncbi:MAG: methanogenesis marker 9 domain-containing protein [Candidatus Lokiarchaeota archaeon]|nr:methanogenesis marker 9 domain-containing protein [Candidatus Lokiarchaeota archaeon]
MLNIDKDKLRDLPGWERNAPVPICMGGDYRALTFCCKPGFSLTFGFKCRRDEKLLELGITPEEFIRIKEEFSKENDWDSEFTCFGSISYCCMRSGGCPRRDVALVERYSGMTLKEIMKTYFEKKKKLSRKILESVRDPEKREKIKPYLDLL